MLTVEYIILFGLIGVLGGMQFALFSEIKDMKKQITMLENDREENEVDIKGVELDS